MNPDSVQKFTQAIQIRLLFWITAIIVFTIGLQWYLQTQRGLDVVVSTLITVIVALTAGTILSLILGAILAKPTKFLVQAIMHIAPSRRLVTEPDMKKLTFGTEMIDILTRQVHNYVNSAQQSSNSSAKNDTIPASLFDQLPLSVVGLDEDNIVVLANHRAITTIQNEKPTGSILKDLLTFNIEDDITLEDWLLDVRENSLTDFKMWQKVEVKTINSVSLGYYDIAVSFNSNSASGVDVVITFYDHSDVYTDESVGVSFVALAVHEMRTPVTIMRGYMEALEEELKDSLTPQISDDLHKMNASAQGLTSFISNILNVARIDQGKLSLKLEEGSWNAVLPQIVDNLRNRATVYGKSIELRMQPDMPTVAIDRMTIGEVVTNLVDNAIKYAPDDTKISIMSQVNREGLIETTVTDKGVGIPETIMPHLFSKFYRNHRNQTKINGTGLGLFLSKSIVTAHKGNIWANSKENEGSTFGFTLLPYSQLASELQSEDTNGIVRNPHGWIKNHSMQRR